MYRQFAKPQIFKRLPRATTVDGDDRRYGELKVPVGDGLFAAYDPLDMKAAKYLIVASSDYLYTPHLPLLAGRDLLDGAYIGLGTVNRHDDKCAKGGQHGAAGDSGCRPE